MGTLASLLLLTVSVLGSFGQEPQTKPVVLAVDQMKKMIVQREFVDVPARVRDFHARGSIVVMVDVNRSGPPTKVKALRKTYQFLTDYVERSISKWKFKPLAVKGDPTEFRGVVIIPFWYGALPEEAPY
jgi:hypothetical protein